MAKRATRDQQLMYGAFADEFQICWICGYEGRGFRDWCLPRLDIAHIVGGPGRRHDRRDVWRACDGCHRISHGAHVRIREALAPMITLNHVLWVKKLFDPGYYDVPYLMSLRVKRCEPIEAEELPAMYQAMFRSKHGKTHEKFCLQYRPS